MAEISRKDLNALNTLMGNVDFDSLDRAEQKELKEAGDRIAQRLLLLAEIEERPFKAIEMKQAKYDELRNRRM